MVRSNVSLGTILFMIAVYWNLLVVETNVNVFRIGSGRSMGVAFYVPTCER
ncbi:hypothetical protein SRABI96_00602 [Peribacillus sp. Bi96]|uniref:hypothetical protein n=1 Tax=unclassified Peribacillus TaxID=2675266 RepID=UPI001D56A352|nr:hypothetical protein [Peribacillus sp. Bi96]CAH0146617.1 hypothetical protein SRABI96_00602 [Peribacillus sp. Bi96]